jgi:hypothetical protein
LLSSDFGYLLNTPAEFVIRLLNDMKAKSTALDQRDRANIDKIILLVSRNKLYRANIQVRRTIALCEQDSEDEAEQLDEEVEGYLRDTVLAEAAPAATILPVLGADSREPSPRGSPSRFEELPEEVAPKLESWDFTASQLCVSPQRVLSVVCTHLVSFYGLFMKLGISKERFVSWAQDVEQGYRINPYHSRMHAVDVVQAMHWLLQRAT